MPWAPSTPPHRRIGGSQRSEATRRPVGECGEMWASSRQCGRLRPETGRTAKKLGVACPKTGPRRVSWAGRHMGLNWAGRWTGLGVAQLVKPSYDDRPVLQRG